MEMDGIGGYSCINCGWSLPVPTDSLLLPLICGGTSPDTGRRVFINREAIQFHRWHSWPSTIQASPSLHQYHARGSVVAFAAVRVTGRNPFQLLLQNQGIIRIHSTRVAIHRLWI